MQTAVKQIKNQRGQSLVEYLIIVAIVGIGSIAITRNVGQQITVKMAKVVEALDGDISGDISNTQVTESAYKKKDFSSFMQGARDTGSGRSSGKQNGNSKPTE
jgi:Flp pilus assembly pilin Flp